MKSPLQLSFSGSEVDDAVMQMKRPSSTPGIYLGRNDHEDMDLGHNSAPVTHGSLGLNKHTSEQSKCNIYTNIRQPSLSSKRVINDVTFQHQDDITVGKTSPAGHLGQAWKDEALKSRGL